MKMQASLEFLLILSAISLVSLGVIVLYGNSIRQTSSAFSNSITGMGTNSTPAANYTQDPAILLYLPTNSTLGQEGVMDIAFYGCSEGTASAYVSSNAMYLQYQSITNISISGIGMSSIAFRPETQGPEYLEINYSMNCGTIRKDGLLSASTFSLPQINSSLQQYGVSAYISDRNETILYSLSGSVPVYSISTWSHCTSTDFFGHVLSEPAQCGDGWDYQVSSPACNTGSTFCMSPSLTGYNVSSTNLANQTLVYSFSLLIGSQLGTIYANIRNGTSSNMTIAGQNVGTARVIQASGSGPNYGYYLIRNKTSERIANSSAYSAYTQSMTSLFATLSYYNQTTVSSSEQSEIQEGITAFNKASASFVTAPGQAGSSGCNLATSSFVCKSLAPFSYQINASVNGIGIANSTIYVAGSEINIKDD